MGLLQLGENGGDLGQSGSSEDGGMKEDWGDVLEPRFAGLVKGLDAEARKSQGRSWKEKGHSYRTMEAAWAGEEVIRKRPQVNSSVFVRDTRCAHSCILEASASASVSSSVKWAWR